jgi:hypothetical protein
MKDGPVFYEKGVRTDVFFSSKLTPGKKGRILLDMGMFWKKTSFGFAKFVSSWP